MKKLLALMLAAALALSLVACGGGSGAGDNNTPSGGNGDVTSTDTPGGGEDSTPSMSKEEMLEAAIHADLYEIHTACFENVLSAKQTYCGKVLNIQAEISEIKMDSIIFTTGETDIVVYLPEEDIAKLKSRQLVTIVGITNEDIVEETNTMGFSKSVFTMEQAYLVSDKYETTVTIINEYNSEWNVRLENGVERWAYFDSNSDISHYIGKKVTISAKLIDGKYYDAVIIE